MFIAQPTAGTAKLRKSGMYSSQLNRQALGSCRSYGAWMSLWIGRYYKHGAPNGAWALSPVDDACKVQRPRAQQDKSVIGSGTKCDRARRVVPARRGLCLGLAIFATHLALFT
jgi:hypothetical protein